MIWSDSCYVCSFLWTHLTTSISLHYIYHKPNSSPAFPQGKWIGNAWCVETFWKHLITSCGNDVEIMLMSHPAVPLYPPATVESRSLAKFLAICGVEKGEIRWRNWMVHHILSSQSLWNEIFMARKSRILVFFISIIIIFPYSFHYSMAMNHAMKALPKVQRGHTPWSANPARIHPEISWWRNLGVQDIYELIMKYYILYYVIL